MYGLYKCNNDNVDFNTFTITDYKLINEKLESINKEYFINSLYNEYLREDILSIDDEYSFILCIESILDCNNNKVYLLHSLNRLEDCDLYKFFNCKRLVNLYHDDNALFCRDIVIVGEENCNKNDSDSYDDSIFIIEKVASDICKELCFVINKDNSELLTTSILSHCIELYKKDNNISFDENEVLSLIIKTLGIGCLNYN